MIMRALCGMLRRFCQHDERKGEKASALLLQKRAERALRECVRSAQERARVLRVRASGTKRGAPAGKSARRGTRRRAQRAPTAVY